MDAGRNARRDECWRDGEHLRRSPVHTSRPPGSKDALRTTTPRSGMRTEAVATPRSRSTALRDPAMHALGRWLSEDAPPADREVVRERKPKIRLLPRQRRAQERDAPHANSCSGLP